MAAVTEKRVKLAFLWGPVRKVLPQAKGAV